MRRIVLLCIIATFGVSIVQAQKGLSISDFFEKPFAKATMVHVEGSELTPYHLTLYRSVSFSDTYLVVDAMEKSVLTDARLAYSKEMGNQGKRLYYAFLALPPRDGHHANRYIFYRNASLREGGKDELTLVYMEGSATMDELKKLFKK